MPRWNELFNGVEHVGQYLSGSFIRVGDRMVYTEGVIQGPSGDDGPTLGVYDAVTWGRYQYNGGRMPDRERAVMDRDPVEFINLPLGYVNLPATYTRTELNECVSVVRIPSRQWRYGFTSNVIRSSVLTRPTGALTSESILVAPTLIDTIMGRYPTLEEALNMESVRAVAFSRYFAVDNERNIWHTSMPRQPVASVRSNGTVRMKRGCTSMKGALEDACGTSQ